VERSEDGEFSSYREYVMGTLPTLEVILQEVGNEDAYRAFVAASDAPNQAIITFCLTSEKLEQHSGQFLMVNGKVRVSDISPSDLANEKLRVSALAQKSVRTTC